MINQPDTDERTDTMVTHAFYREVIEPPRRHGRLMLVALLACALVLSAQHVAIRRIDRSYSIELELLRIQRDVDRIDREMLRDPTIIAVPAERLFVGRR